MERCRLDPFASHDPSEVVGMVSRHGEQQAAACALDGLSEFTHDCRLATGGCQDLSSAAESLQVSLRRPARRIAPVVCEITDRLS
jgi:hypothetical protein